MNIKDDKTIYSLEGKKNISFSDYLTLSLAILLIAIGFALFKYNPLSISPLRDLSQVATIHHLEFESKRKIPGSLSWIKTESKAPLYQGDQILTGQNSSVTVEFKKGSKLFIGPQSLIRIEVIDNEYQVFLVKGELKLEGTEELKVIDSQTGQSLKVQNNQKITSTALGLTTNNIFKGIKQGRVIDPNTNTRIDFDLTQKHTGSIVITGANGKKLLTQPISGSSNISTPVPAPGKYTTTLLDAQNKVVGKTTFTVTPYQIPEFKSLPKDNNFIRGEVLPLEWTGRNDLKYKLTIQTPEGVKEQQILGTKHAIYLKESGKYSFQISVDSDGAGYSGKKVQMDIALSEGVVIPEGQLIQNVSAGKHAIYNIENILNDDPVYMEISTQENFSTLLKAFPATTNPRYKIRMERPGIFFVRAKTKGLIEVPSKTSRVTVTAPVANPAKNYQSKQVLTPEKTESSLSWINEPSQKNVRLVISKDPDFKTRLLDEKTSQSSRSLKVPEGTYFWKILPADNIPEYILPSSVQRLEVALPSLGTPHINDKQILQYTSLNGKSYYSVKLQPYQYAKKYFLEIYADKSLKRDVFKKISNRTLIPWDTARAGRFFYRVKVQDHWGRISDYSKVGELIFPISPMVEL